MCSFVCVHVSVCVLGQSPPTLCDPTNCSPPGSSIHPRKEYWSGQPFPSPGGLPHSGVEPRSPALQVYSLPSEPPGKPMDCSIPGFSVLHYLSEFAQIMSIESVILSNHLILCHPLLLLLSIFPSISCLGNLPVALLSKSNLPWGQKEGELGPNIFVTWKLVQIHLPGMESYLEEKRLILEAQTKTAMTLGTKHRTPLHTMPASVSLCLHKHLWD